MNILILCAKLSFRRSQWPRGLRPLENWDLCSNPTRGTEFCVRLFCLSCSVYVAALRRANPPSKETHRLCID
jgi:hypothetical protein